MQGIWYSSGTRSTVFSSHAHDQIPCIRVKTEDAVLAVKASTAKEINEYLKKRERCDWWYLAYFPLVTRKLESNVWPRLHWLNLFPGLISVYILIFLGSDFYSDAILAFILRVLVRSSLHLCLLSVISLFLFPAYLTPSNMPAIVCAKSP